MSVTPAGLYWLETAAVPVPDTLHCRPTGHDPVWSYRGMQELWFWQLWSDKCCEKGKSMRVFQAICCGDMAPELLTALTYNISINPVPETWAMCSVCTTKYIIQRLNQ